jgi:hypothetical protein
LFTFNPNFSDVSPVKFAKTVLYAAGTNIEILNG